jgi:hypothetical protein
MTDSRLTDGLIRSALGPGALHLDVADMAEAVSDRTRTTSQQAPRFWRPWLPSPAATMHEVQRARLVRIAMLAMLAMAAVGAVAAGAQLLPPPAAPPQWLLVQNGDGYAVPFSGGDRRSLAAFTGLDIADVSTSLDGARLSTVRGARNEVLEIWDANAVFAQRETEPVRYDMPPEIRIFDAGVWRRDGSGILFGGSDHGVTRIFLLDLATRGVSQISPNGMNVDDWQPAPNGRWLEILGQGAGTYALYVLDLDTLELRTMIKSNGVDIPVGGALGWSPDSAEMTVRLERRIVDGGIWALRPDGTQLRRLTPVGQSAWSMNWSPDGAWIMYIAEAANQSCMRSYRPSRLVDTWLVRADGTESHLAAGSAFPMQWSDDSLSVLVESQLPRQDAPLGGVIRVFVDGRSSELVYAYREQDRDTGEICHPYGVLTKMYRGNQGNRR